MPEEQTIAGPAPKRTRQVCHGAPSCGGLGCTVSRPNRAAKGRPCREPGRRAPTSHGSVRQPALRASRVRVAEGEPRWGRRRRGGGGSRAAAPAPVGEERQRRRLELLWRPTRGGGGGGGGGRGDPPLSTWTVAKASADAFTPGRGGRTAVAAAAAERVGGLEAPDGRGDRRGRAAILRPGTQGGVFVCSLSSSSPGNPRLGERFSGSLGGRWMGSRGPSGTGPGKRRRRRRRSRSPGGA